MFTLHDGLNRRTIAGARFAGPRTLENPCRAARCGAFYTPPQARRPIPDPAARGRPPCRRKSVKAIGEQKKPKATAKTVSPNALSTEPAHPVRQAAGREIRQVASAAGRSGDGRPARVGSPPPVIRPLAAGPPFRHLGPRRRRKPLRDDTVTRTVVIGAPRAPVPFTSRHHRVRHHGAAALVRRRLRDRRARGEPRGQRLRRRRGDRCAPAIAVPRRRPRTPRRPARRP